MTYKVRLEVFEGPLDLLLYLIKKEEINIYDIPIAKITDQYLGYLEVMQLLDLKLAGEFLVMAATLMHIKSRMLLPPEELTPEIEEEEDPRAELIRKLLEYKKFKEAANQLQNIEAKREKIYTRFVSDEEKIDFGEGPFFEANLFDLISAFSKVLKDIPRERFHEIIKDETTVEEKIHELLHLLMIKPVVHFTKLFESAKSKIEIITIFLALLELIRLKEVIVRQPKVFGEIYIIRSKSHITPIMPQLSQINE